MTDENPMDAERIIAAFGGIRPMAKKIGVAVTTVQGWKERGNIPMNRMGRIRELAKEEGIDLDNLPPAGTATEDDKGGDKTRSSSSASSAASGAGRASRNESVRAEKVERDTGGDGGVKDAGSAETVIEGRAARGRSGLLRPAVMAGAFGITLAVGVVAGWQIGLLKSGEGGADLSELRTQITVAETEIASQQTTIGNLQQRLTAAESAAQEANRSAGALESRVAALSETADGLASLRSELASVNQEVQTLSNRITAMAATGQADPQAAARLTTLVQQVQSFSQQLAGYEGRISGFDTRLAAIDGRIDALTEQMNSQQGADPESVARAVGAARQALEAENARLSQRIANLTQRVEALAAAQERIAEGASGEAALILALGQLQGAVIAGRDYADLLTHFERLSAGRPGYAEPVRALRARANDGIATMDTLRQRFDGLGVRIVRAGRLGEEGDWAERSLNRLRSLVVIRRTGADVEGNTPEAIVSRAEAALRAGELETAVTELAALEGDAAAAAAPWLADARAHLAATEAVATLNRLAIGAAEDAAENGGASDTGGETPQGQEEQQQDQGQQETGGE